MVDLQGTRMSKCLARKPGTFKFQAPRFGLRSKQFKIKLVSYGLFVMHVPGSRAQRCPSELTFGLKSQRSPIKTRFMDVCAR